MQWQIIVLLILVALKAFWFGITPLFTDEKASIYTEGRLSGLVYLLWAGGQAALILSLL